MRDATGGSARLYATINKVQARLVAVASRVATQNLTTSPFPAVPQPHARHSWSRKGRPLGVRDAFLHRFAHVQRRNLPTLHS